MDSVVVKSLVCVKNGVFIELDAVRDDFWLYLGKHAGWACLSQAIKRWEEVDDPLLYEIIAIMPAHMPEPSPVLLLANVLGRKRDAVEEYIHSTLLPYILSSSRQGAMDVTLRFP